LSRPIRSGEVRGVTHTRTTTPASELEFGTPQIVEGTAVTATLCRSEGQVAPALQGDFSTLSDREGRRSDRKDGQAGARAGHPGRQGGRAGGDLRGSRHQAGGPRGQDGRAAEINPPHVGRARGSGHRPGPGFHASVLALRFGPAGSRPGSCETAAYPK